MPTITCCTGLPPQSLGLTKSVAPSAVAAVNFLGLMSTAMMRLAPAMRAAWMTDRPTAPRPKTATDEPSSTLHVFHTAPKPVATPQPKRLAFSKGIAGLILAHEIAASTLYSDMVLQPMKWYSCVPSDAMVKRLVPSGMNPCPCVERIVGQRLVLGLWQKMHCGEAHCGV